MQIAIGSKHSAQLSTKGLERLKHHIQEFSTDLIGEAERLEPPLRKDEDVEITGALIDQAATLLSMVRKRKKTSWWVVALDALSYVLLAIIPATLIGKWDDLGIVWQIILIVLLVATGILIMTIRLHKGSQTWPSMT